MTKLLAIPATYTLAALLGLPVEWVAVATSLVALVFTSITFWLVWRAQDELATAIEDRAAETEEKAVAAAMALWEASRQKTVL